MTNILKDIADLLLPRFCAICGERLTPQEKCICVTCLRNLPFTYTYLHPQNNIEKQFWYHIPIERAASYLFYEGEGLMNAIQQFKYRSRPDIGLFFATLMAREYAEHDFFKGMDVIVPVPLHWEKQIKRGYNQCHYIAQAIHDVTGLPIEKHAVVRTKNNKPQALMHHSKRSDNVKAIFKLKHPERLQGKHVLLIDDIITTGATIMSCAQEIAKSDDVKISIVSLAFAGKKFILTNNVSKN